MSKPVFLSIVIIICFSSAFAQNWVQMGGDIDGEAADDHSGQNVSMSANGQTLAIGARGNDGNGDLAGHVSVFSWSGSTWTQKGSSIDGEASGDLSGVGVSMSSDGNTVAIGARANDGNGTYSGHVRVFAWSGTTWTQKGTDIDGEAEGDFSGWSVSMSSDGNTLAIGAPWNNGVGEVAGHVRVFSWNGSDWAQKGSDMDGEAAGDFSGKSVSMSSDGNTLAIGAPWNNGAGKEAGHVRVYSYQGSSGWVQLGKDIDGEAEIDRSGSTVSISTDGKTLAIGAIHNDGNGTDAGHVRVFNWSGSTWVQKGSDLDGETRNDNSGFRLNLSSDGKTLAIGAYNNDGNGPESGHVRVFTWSDSAWTQKGLDLDGEAAGDRSGYSVSMSSDGNIMAIGALDNDGNGVHAGHVRVFRYGWPSVLSFKITKSR